uniref:Uncharacterized protein n=1 Tax=Erpetoichthys calabaricus TaxID=27687 RepID=A0A8C4T604_ERPCA
MRRLIHVQQEWQNVKTFEANVKGRTELGYVTPHSNKHLKALNLVIFPVSCSDKFHKHVIEIGELKQQSDVMNTED